MPTPPNVAVTIDMSIYSEVPDPSGNANVGQFEGTMTDMKYLGTHQFELVSTYKDSDPSSTRGENNDGVFKVKTALGRHEIQVSDPCELTVLNSIIGMPTQLKVPEGDSDIDLSVGGPSDSWS